MRVSNKPLIANLLTIILLLPLSHLAFSSEAFTDSQEKLIRDLRKQAKKKLYQKAINGKIPLNSHDRKGFTPLWNAVTWDDVSAVKTLLQKGADVNFPKSSNDCPPILAAAQTGNSELIELLFTHGANLDVMCNGTITPIFISVDLNFIEASKTLLKLGANPNSEYAYEKESHMYGEGLRTYFTTPLYQATIEKKYSLIKPLLEAGADPHWIRPSDLTTPLLRVINPEKYTDEERRKMIRLYSQGGADFDVISINAKDSHPIDRARKLNDLVVLEEFFKLGYVKPFIYDGKYTIRIMNPIIWEASRTEDYRLLKMALDYGMSPNEYANFSDTPLISAVMNGDPAIVRTLIEAGADVNHIGFGGNTALFYTYKQPEIRKILLDAGASVAARNVNGWTALDTWNMLEEKERKQAIAEAKRKERERLREQEESSGFNWAKALAMTAGFVAGGGLELDAAAQSDVISSIVQDGFSASGGTSKTMQALQQTSQRYHAQNSINNQLPHSSSSNRNAKDHYADIRGRSDLKSCNFASTQANSFCQTANTYYNQYLKVVNNDPAGAEQIYAVHKRTVRDMMNLVNNHQNKTTLVLDDSAGKSCDTVMSRLAKQLSCQQRGVSSYEFCFTLDRTAPSHCTKQCSDRFQSMLASLDCSIKPSKGGQRGQAVRN